MKVKVLYLLSMFFSVNTLAAIAQNDAVNKQDMSREVRGDVLETANLMDEINLLKLKFEKEQLDKSLNEELLKNIEVKKEIDKYDPVSKVKKQNPADGPFNVNGIRLLSVTSLQNANEMAVFSFYGRKYNRAPGEDFKGANISIDGEYVVFEYHRKSYKFRY
ncbi:hypothetical protein Sps_04832 [Shewanella psychrophila]|uniref:Type IV pilus biogenesis protein PilP n=1 Tax=Shewanella psychrophila TaxID=225848 RepID=A0A1S6HWV7_9GAMM|nr:hypothetical protein [Shewanella psychrophila]AQS39914.1 hypothetical protein Sps_04832 [Shewanella psychrophila]